MAKLLNLRKFFHTEENFSFKHKHFLNQLSAAKQEEILLYSEGDHIAQILPKLKDKKILIFNDMRHNYLLKKTTQQEPGQVIHFIYKGEPPATQIEGLFSVVGDFKQMPLRKNYYDVVICPFVLEEFYLVISFIEKISPFLRNGARLILSVRHPQFENHLTNQNPTESRVAESLISKYFHVLQDNHFFTEDLLEGIVDLALKPFFSDTTREYYHEYKNTPISFFIKAVKFKKNKTTEPSV